jgi:predicted nucleic acid-binding protein
MKVFCDTNVLVAAFLAQHPQHHAARPVLERIKAGSDEGWAATHSLAETYAVLTRLPCTNYVSPGTTLQLISENIIRNFSLIVLSATDYSKALERAAANGVEGGRIYDVLLPAAAAKSGAGRIYTFNLTHFQALANDDIRGRIVVP